MNAQTLRTVEMLRYRKSLGLSRPRAGMPAQRHPIAIEASYGGALAKLVDRARDAYRPLLAELPDIVDAARRARGDSLRWDVGEGKRAREAVQRARRALQQALPTDEIEAVARKFATQTQTNQRLQLGTQLHQALGINVLEHVGEVPNLPALVDHFVSENVSLITSIPDVMGTDIDKIVQRGLTSGTPVDQLRADITERFGVGERHARVIARDQVGKLYGQVNRVRQKAVGIDEFDWETANDERVREEHQVLNGKRFRWDAPPAEGIPGEPIQCRCTGQPVLGNILDLLG